MAASRAVRAAVKLPKRVRVVLIGLQGHPTEILNPLSDLPDVELVGIVDRNQKAAAGAQKKAPKARLYTDYRQALDREKPDVVAVCNAADERAPAILAAIDRKMHWIAEKPIANSMDELLKIRHEVTQARLQYSMLLPMRFDSPYLALRQIVESGQLGEIGQISSQKSYKAGDRDAWMKKRKSYGGTIAWIGIHMIDLMRFTSGREFQEAFSFQGQVAPTPGIGEMENTTGTVFRMDNGGVATLHMDYYRPEASKTHGDDRLRLAGSKGVAEYMEATGVTLIGPKGLESIRELPARRSVFVDFLEGLYAGKKRMLSQADVFRTSEIALRARDGAEKGQVVKV
jgi:predicted dehydrogenase